MVKKMHTITWYLMGQIWQKTPEAEKNKNKTKIWGIVIDNMYYHDQRNGTALARLIRKRQVMNYA